MHARMVRLSARLQTRSMLYAECATVSLSSLEYKYHGTSDNRNCHNRLCACDANYSRLARVSTCATEIAQRSNSSNQSYKAMNTQTPFFIFSVQREQLPAEENRRRVEFVSAYIRKSKIPFLHVQGRDKDNEETSFYVDDGLNRRQQVLNLARLYDQESVLAVDANGLASSLYSSEGGTSM